MEDESIRSNEGFYIGDPCYVLSEKIYEGIWGGKGFLDGKIDCGDYSFMVYGTAYGDGCYDLYSENRYLRDLPVDSGTLSIIPLELVDNKENAVRLGYIQEGKCSKLFYDNGKFSIEIDDHKFNINTLEEEFEYEI